MSGSFDPNGFLDINGNSTEYYGQNTNFTSPQPTKYTLGYDTQLFPFLQPGWIEKNDPAHAVELNAQGGVNNPYNLIQYYRNSGMPNTTTAQQTALRQAVFVRGMQYANLSSTQAIQAWAKSDYRTTQTPSMSADYKGAFADETHQLAQDLLKQFNGSTNQAAAFANQNQMATNKYYKGKGDSLGDSLKGFGAFIAIAGSMGTAASLLLPGASLAAAGASTTTGSVLSGSSGLTSVIGSAGVDTLEEGAALKSLADGASAAGGLFSNAAGDAASFSLGDIAPAVGGAGGLSSDVVAGASAAGTGAGILDLIGSAVSGISNVVSGAANIAGALAPAASTLQQANAANFEAQQAQMGYASQVDNYNFMEQEAVNNSSISLANKAYEAQKLIANNSQQDTTNQRQAGAITSGYGASGVVNSSGSAALVKSDQANQGALQIALNTFESNQRQEGYQEQSDSALAQAGQYKKAAATATTNAATAAKYASSNSSLLTDTAIVKGVSAIPQIVNGATWLYNDIIKYIA